MSYLILVRHGQSLWNKEKRFTGWADIELTDQGKKEAAYAGKLIKKLDIEFNAYFTSQLKRASNTLDIILKTLNSQNAIIIKAWELNERHYGNLTSLSRDEIIKKLGKKQVQIWRRSFNISPPPMDRKHPYSGKIFSNIPKEKMPNGESLKDTYERVIPYYKSKIEPLILSNKNVLVVFHGNTCRSLLKKIFNVSQKKIINFEIPTGNPLLIKFDKLQVKETKYLDPKRAKKIFSKV